MNAWIPGLLFTMLLADHASTKPALPTVVSAEPDQQWTARFRQSDGWVGADGAYSVLLPNSKTLWLFSDTFIGSVRKGKRVKVKMVNNTIGIQMGSGPSAKLAFAIRQEQGKPKAMLAPPVGKSWYWLQAGVEAGEKLFLFAPRIESTGKGGAFGFQQVGQDLLAVSNPDAQPTAWKVNTTSLPFVSFKKERTVSYGAAVLKEGKTIYVYGFDEARGGVFPNRRLVVAKAPASKLQDFAAWQFLGNDHQWKSNPAEAAPLADGLATEFSVSYLPSLKKYALVYTENGLGDRILGRFAPSPVGPWSKPVLLYRCPEMKASKKLFSYAAKAHPQLAGPSELIITYCVNSFEFRTVIENADLYWPNFVRVKLK